MKNVKLLMFLAVLTLISQITVNAQIAYVPNSNDDNVSVVNLSSYTVIATIAVGNNPRIAEVNPSNTKVYVINVTDNTISIIDIATNTVTNTIILAGSDINGVVFNSTGTKAYVTIGSDDNVAVINTATETVSSTITVGNTPHGITINPAGTILYVSNRNDGSVSVIDVASETVTNTITVFSTPAVTAFNTDGTKVYVGKMGNDINIIDASTEAVTNTITTSWGLMAMSTSIKFNPTGAKAYMVVAGVDYLSVIDAVTETETTLTIGSIPTGVGFNATGTIMYVTDRSNTLSVRDVATNTEIASITIGSSFEVNGNFILQTFDISASVSPANSGTITGAGTFNYGETASLVATPATGYNFVNWTENGTEVSTNATYSFTVNGNRTLVANFNNTTGISNLDNDKLFEIYPNPTNELLNIKFNNLSINSQSDIKLYLIDNIGKQIELKVLSFNSTVIQTNIGNNKSGIYYLQLIVNDELTKSFKVILTD